MVISATRSKADPILFQESRVHLNIQKHPLHTPHEFRISTLNKYGLEVSKKILFIVQCATAKRGKWFEGSFSLCVA